MTDAIEEIFGNVISAYTRADAIRDGVLVDLSAQFPNDTRMFKWNVACTDSAFNMFQSAADEDECETSTYVWDVCYMAMLAVQAVKDSTDTIFFSVMLPLLDNCTGRKLKLVCSPDDEGAPCITIMLPHED